MDVRTTTGNGVATIEIARLGKKNVLTMETFVEMADAVAAAMEDEAVRALLIVGQPKVFTAGYDVRDFMPLEPHSPHRHGFPLGWSTSVFRFMNLLLECDKPVVAAVAGPAISIGTTMLLHCDLVYVSDDARLEMPFTRFALRPDFASTALVPLLMGNAKAAEAMLLGEPIDGAQAVELGIATAVFPADEVLQHARRVAERFNSLPPAAVRESKRLMRKAKATLVANAMRDEGAAVSERLRSLEAREAFAAFFAKRKPDFSRF